MKAHLVFAMIAAATFCHAARAAVSTAGMTPEQKKEHYRQLKEKVKRSTGGMVQDRRAMKGSVVFLDAQKLIGQSNFEKVSSALAAILRADVRTAKSDEPVSFGQSLATKGTLNANILIVVSADPQLASALVIAPEANVAYVNMHALGKDAPDNPQLERRTRREMLRAFGYLCGADALDAGSVMQPVADLTGLDELVGESFSQESVISAIRHLKAAGVEPFKIVPYKKAVTEGWAKPPTNEYQKAVWDKVHSIPKNPMKIEFDPKKGR